MSNEGQTMIGRARYGAAAIATAALAVAGIATAIHFRYDAGHWPGPSPAGPSVGSSLWSQ